MTTLAVGQFVGTARTTDTMPFRPNRQGQSRTTRDAATVNQRFSAAMSAGEREYRSQPVRADESLGSRGEGGSEESVLDSTTLEGSGGFAHVTHEGACGCKRCIARRATAGTRDGSRPIRTLADLNRANRKAFGRKG